MIPADKRYRDDIHFKALVDTMYAMIARLDSTPTEIREAAMLAQIKYEMANPRPICFSQDVLEAFQAQRDADRRKETKDDGLCPHGKYICIKCSGIVPPSKDDKV